MLISSLTVVAFYFILKLAGKVLWDYTPIQEFAWTNTES